MDKHPSGGAASLTGAWGALESLKPINCIHKGTGRHFREDGAGRVTHGLRGGGAFLARVHTHSPVRTPPLERDGRRTADVLSRAYFLFSFISCLSNCKAGHVGPLCSPVPPRRCL